MVKKSKKLPRTKTHNDRHTQILEVACVSVQGDVIIPGKRSSNQEQALRAITAAVDRLDTVDSGLTSCDTGWRANVQGKCWCCYWSPRRLAERAEQGRK